MRLEAESLVAGYDARNILEGVSVRVATGEFVGLLGQNGSGKSTLLRVLSHALKPHSGTVTLDGKEITQWSPRDRAKRIAFVPQQETTTFAFTVQDVVMMGRYPHLERNRREQATDYAAAHDAMKMTDILLLKDRPVTKLSGGEYRRVLMARALAQQSPLLLLDEPTAHLDIAHQAELLMLARNLAHRPENSQGVLAALHDINQAAEFCDRIVLLHAGGVFAEGAPDAVLTEDNLRHAYHAEIRMGQNPLTGRPMILSLSPEVSVPPSADNN
jgi:iron complex transport system ATP-binding protein